MSKGKTKNITWQKPTDPAVLIIAINITKAALEGK